MLPVIQSNGRSGLFACLVLICLAAGPFTGCIKEDSHPRSYPQVKTNPVTNITGKGATFHGNIYTLGSEPILDHGFVWGEWVDPDMTNDRIFLGPLPKGGQ